jgi:hypothetical protein
MQCVILRTFGGPGTQEFHPGELVDTVAWPNADLLIGARMIRQATPEEIASAVEVDEAPLPVRMPVKTKGKGKR